MTTGMSEINIGNNSIFCTDKLYCSKRVGIPHSWECNSDTRQIYQNTRQTTLSQGWYTTSLVKKLLSQGWYSLSQHTYLNTRRVYHIPARTKSKYVKSFAMSRL